ncbi:MAG: reverse transcriptase/maturase family protein [Candidatus Kaiserbacteria bacterium]|nr:reverse transcriptase/maturase family protein [Candidatus Kaiserbacteria bacterium]
MRGGDRLHCTEYSISPRTPFTASFESVVTKENLYRAWNDFVRGKRHRQDVNAFALHLSDNLYDLYVELVSQKYVHGTYEEYTVYDPKKRVIHKASVRDRVVHRLLYNSLYPHFDKRFIHDSYSCRVGKGTHKARDRFRRFANQVSRNYTRPCSVLKFDIKKCFESINQEILKRLMREYIEDEHLNRLIEVVIDSFGKGLPLGNLTSQLFVNVYLHELDHYAKQTLKIPHYIRYADDVLVVHESSEFLREVFTEIDRFLSTLLLLHTHKTRIQSLYSGVDVLGEVFFEKYKRLRRSTERREKRRQLLIKKACQNPSILVN